MIAQTLWHLFGCAWMAVVLWFGFACAEISKGKLTGKNPFAK